VDIGTGAGFPGIPLAIASGRETHLVESVRKKAEFVRAVVERLRLNVTVHPIRAEDAAIVLGGRFAVATARAVAPLVSLVELAAPFLAVGGLAVFLKGKPEDAELRAARTAAGRVGLVEKAVRRVHVPDLEAARTIVVYEKTADSSIQLPRRVGLAQNKPLV